MLKPIPRENPDKKAARAKKKKNKKKPWHSKLPFVHKHEGRDESVIRIAKAKLETFIKRRPDCPKEIQATIHELQRSILALNRKRLHILTKKNKKRKK